MCREAGGVQKSAHRAGIGCAEKCTAAGPSSAVAGPAVCPNPFYEQYFPSTTNRAMARGRVCSEHTSAGPRVCCEHNPRLPRISLNPHDLKVSHPLPTMKNRSYTRGRGGDLGQAAPPTTALG